jgi:hypothetical protein
MANIPGWPNTPGGGYYYDGYMDYGYFIKSYLQPLADVGVERVAPAFVRMLRQYDPKIVRRIVETNFPQWLEEFDKLLVLK